MKASCPALRGGKYIPTKFAHRGVKGGENISLPLTWTEVPPGTLSLALLIVDRHPIARNWLHWCVMNIPADTNAIAENASALTGQLPAACVQMRNSFGESGYGGPQPPKGSGPHEYEITIHALKLAALPVNASASLNDVTRALAGNVLASASVTGIFEQ